MKFFSQTGWSRARYSVALIMLIYDSQSYAAGKSIPSDTRLPATFIGTWQVKEVRIDSGVTRTLLYQHNDPRLTGHIFAIGRERLTSNTPEEKSCEAPGIAAKLNRISNLIETSMGGRGLPPERRPPQIMACT
jgi:hypothetical protein